MTAREREVLELIRRNPTISYAEIASALGISRSTVAVYIASLTAQGEIMGKQFVLAENYVVCIGESAMDIYGFTGETGREGGSRIRVVSGGVARNIGENLARLGDSVKLLSVTGDDRFGEMIQRDCADAGIDTAGIIVRRGAHTPAFLQLTGAGGEPMAAVREGSPEAAVDIEYIKQKEHIIKGARGLVVCGIPVTAIEYLHDTFPEKKIHIDMTTMSEDPGIQGCLGCFHSVQANKREAEKVTGVRIRVITYYSGSQFPNDVSLSEVMLVQHASASGAMPAQGNQTAVIYESRPEVSGCELLDRLSTRSGPGTVYQEPGTFFRNNTWKGRTVRVLKKGRGDGVWWVQVDFQTDNGNRYRVWTGKKRVDVDLDKVSEEIPIGDCDIYATSDTRWGPGGSYAAANVVLRTNAVGNLYEVENGWADVEYYCNDGSHGRVWVPQGCVYNVDTSKDRSGEN